ncbi:MAG TPA: ABC transporter permease [Vicinamibacterales bacterium]|nr:ABC transporter permease [Vicinamibacterales bacterium]
MLRDWILRLRSLVRRDVVEQELDDELQFHMEQQVAAYMSQGLSRDDAMRRARLEFGGLAQIKDEHRDARGVGTLDHLARDLRSAFRQVRRAPGFAALAVLCLGLGIGVNTSIFGVLNSVLFRSMPVADPERLIVVSRGDAASFSYPNYRDFLAGSRTLSGLTASLPMESDLDVDGESEFVAAEVVPANYAEVIGVRLALGQWFVNDAEPGAVISHAIWQRRFNLSPEVLGRTIRSESQSYTVVGVAPREFSGIFAPLRTDIWVPLRTRPSLAAQLEDRTRRHLMLFGRLSDDATAAQASAELNAIDGRLIAEQGASPERLAPIAVEEVRGIPNPGGRRRIQTVATLLSAVVGLVLLIACVNVGNLLMARGAVRQREFAVRRALGATRGRVLQQLLTENLMLAVGGGICGVVLARWTNALLERSLPLAQSLFPMQLDLSLDWRVIAYATMLSLAATVVCGMLPAWRASQTDALVAFKGEVVAGLPRRRPVGLVAQVVMSFVLLLVAGTFLQALVRMQSTDPGFAVAGRLYAYTFIPTSTPESARQFYSLAIDRLRALPGVRTTALTHTLPLMPSGSDCASRPGRGPVPITTGIVGPGFFDTMRIGMISGRDFTAADVSGDGAVVVLNERLARALWPDRPPIGERVMVGCQDAKPALVIGVARDSVVRSLGESPQPHLYVPFAMEHSTRLTTILLETSTPPGRMVEPVRRTLLGLGQGVRVYGVQPMSDYLEKSLWPMRWQTSIFTGFGMLALLLAAIGLYGVITYRVARRTREIGVRMAVGAGRRDVFREVVGQGLSIALVGVAIGEVLAVTVAQVLGSMQSDIRPPGLVVLVGTGVLWIAVAVLATYVPAARAARVNPLVALRYE